MIEEGGGANRNRTAVPNGRGNALLLYLPTTTNSLSLSLFLPSSSYLFFTPSLSVRCPPSTDISLWFLHGGFLPTVVVVGESMCFGLISNPVR